MFHLLVIDDEPNIRFSIEQVFEGTDVRVRSAGTREEGLQGFASERPDLVLLDLRLGEGSGLELFDELRRRDAKCLVVFITGHGSAETAIEAMKRGAFDYLVKPLDALHLQQVVTQACGISRLMRTPTLVDDTDRPEDSPDRLIGRGAAMQAVCKQIGRVAPQDVNVLILGESGTGKELVARALYHHSRRNQAPFLAINCAAIPETLLESELFGHERGAFTGAERRRVGKFEQCHGGTLFLDEVGDMAPVTQAKILRLLQEGQFERVGGSETLHADVRIIAATNQNLETMIEQGRFRRDLYYRLRGVTLHLPPLRHRLDDVPELAHHFLFQFNRQLGTQIYSIAEAAMELLQRYHWPGNVRELQSVIREALIVSTGPTLAPEFLPPELHAPSSDYAPSGSVSALPSVNNEDLVSFVEKSLASGQSDVYRRALELFDRVLIPRALNYSKGNQAQAAARLGLSRPTLRAKLRVLAEQVPQTQEAESDHP